ncbi:MAG: diguanylate cyclase [wastewater metagenome]|nr:diguanylate cyclase [Candidatus Loosdrechtia aerotolerans]
MVLKTVQDYGVEQAPRLCILVAENKEYIHQFLKTTLEREGHHIIVVEKGEEIFHLLESEVIDLLILDSHLPDISAVDIFYHLREDPLWQSLPVIMLVDDQLPEDRGEDLFPDVNDYITKPLTKDKLLAHLQIIYERCLRNIKLNPLTRLPSNIVIEREIRHRIARKHKFSVLYCDINHFTSYNDTYGFVQGDTIIRTTARLLLSCVDHCNDLVGHMGGDDFIIVTSPDKSIGICESIVKKFDNLVPKLYSKTHIKTGFVVTQDRKGILRKFPLISIAIGGVSNEWKELTSLGEINTIGEEMKRFAKHKGEGKSAYAFDRRKGLAGEDIDSGCNKIPFKSYEDAASTLNKSYQSRIKKILQMIECEVSKQQNRKNASLLSIGCGSGMIEKQIMDLGIQVCGIGLSSRTVTEAQKKGIDISIADINCGLPCDDGAFDIVFAGEIIEHIIEIQKFLLEVKRVLKPGGAFIFTIPNMARFADRIRFLFGKTPKHASSWNTLHIRHFTFGSLKIILERTGFTVIQTASNVVSYDFTSLCNFESAWLANLFPSLGKNLIIKAFSSHTPFLEEKAA